ncbi:F-box protein [Aspergillus fijiensis CBS 313.89]|uniref:Leucine-rich repeat domain-containing protein n=1 Tax=Aspergillus fijiensis CBS 313.89 TaxID=1448319 RepID=A0A8G1RMP5_9EURO|nr:uncharacterized protein BO72DRAFT_173319 [Aspergillus fijiensis CBS 313.89]RAK75267.1 hypothetical protein BO72DRAFT_173319 [Aspergillus fijiensis CBS 313.89]
MEKLPNEILLLIGEENIQGSEYMDYLPLLLVCRHWRSLFLSDVYNVIRLNEKQIKPFLVTVQSNPSVATSIVALNIKASNTNFEVARNDISSIGSRIAEMGQSAEETTEWEEELLRGGCDAWIAVLLTYLPNLSGFIVEPASLIGRYIRSIVTRAAAREAAFTSILQELYDFSIVPPDQWVPSQASDYLPFFNLPSMRQVTLWCGLMDSDSGDTMPGLGFERGTLPITEIVIMGNGRYGMRELIKSCQNLEVFDWQHNDIELLGESYRRFRPRAFYTSLSTQKHSLVELRLHGQSFYDIGSDFDEDDDGEAESELDPPDNWFGSLADFVKLQELRMRVVNLLDFRSESFEPNKALKNILPGSLKRLFLTECHAEHTDRLHQELMELFACRTQKFPHLGLLIIVCKFLKGMEPPTATRYECVPDALQKSFIEPIKAAAEVVGVDFGAAYKRDVSQPYFYATI